MVGIDNEASSDMRELAFVGDTLWAQYGTSVLRYRDSGSQAALQVIAEARMTRVEGSWVVFQMRYSDVGRDNIFNGVWLYDAAKEQWYTGKWPDGVACFLAEGMEPEDLDLIDHSQGILMDASGWGDRHNLRSWSPDGRILYVDGVALDVETGSYCGLPPMKGWDIEEAISSSLPMLGKGGDEHHDCSTLAVTDDELWWIYEATQNGSDEAWERMIGGVLGVNGEARAFVHGACCAAAFSLDATRVALMTEAAITVHALDTLGSVPIASYDIPPELREQHRQSDDDDDSEIPF